VPELPDVEGYRSSLARALPGRRVCQVDVRDAGVLRNTTPRTLDRQLAGHRLVIDLDRGQLRYSDLRKLRGVWLAGDDDEVVG